MVGNHRRLGLVKPNLFEQMMLARCRLYHAAVKASSNQSGHVNLNHSSAVKLNAVLFRHDTPEVAAKLLNLSDFLNPDELQDLLNVGRRWTPGRRCTVEGHTFP